MAQSGSTLAGLDHVAARAGTGFLTGLGAGRSLGLGPFTEVMAQSLDGLFLGIGVGLTLEFHGGGVDGLAGLGAGGSDGLNSDLGLQHFLVVAVLAGEGGGDDQVLRGVVAALPVPHGLAVVVAGARNGNLLHVGEGLAVELHGGGVDGLAFLGAAGGHGLHGDLGVQGLGVVALLAGEGGGGSAQVLGPGPHGLAVDVLMRRSHDGDLQRLFLNSDVAAALLRFHDHDGVNAGVLVVSEVQGSQHFLGGDLLSGGVSQGDDAILHMDGAELSGGQRVHEGQDLGIVGDGDQAVGDVLILGQDDGDVAVSGHGIIDGLAGIQADDLASDGVGGAGGLVGGTDLDHLDVGSSVVHGGSIAHDSDAVTDLGHLSAGVGAGGDVDGLRNGAGVVAHVHTGQDLSFVNVQDVHVADVVVTDGHVDLALTDEIGQVSVVTLVRAGGGEVIGNLDHLAGISRGASIQSEVLSGVVAVHALGKDGEVGVLAGLAQVDGGGDGPVVGSQLAEGVGVGGGHDAAGALIGLIRQIHSAGEPASDGAALVPQPAVVVGVGVHEGPVSGICLEVEGGNSLGALEGIHGDLVSGGDDLVEVAHQAGHVVRVQSTDHADLASLEVDEPHGLVFVVGDDQAVGLGVLGVGHVHAVDEGHGQVVLILHGDAGLQQRLEGGDGAGDGVDVDLIQNAGGGQHVVDIQGAAVVSLIQTSKGKASHVGDIGAQVPAIQVGGDKVAGGDGEQHVVLLELAVLIDEGGVVGHVGGRIGGVLGEAHVQILFLEALGGQNLVGAGSARHVVVAEAAAGGHVEGSLGASGAGGGAVQQDGGEAGALGVGHLTLDGEVQSNQRLHDHMDGLSELHALGVGIHGGDNDVGLAGLQTGDNAVLIGGNGRIGNLNGVLVGFAHLDLDVQLSSLGLEELDLSGINLQNQIGGGLILMQADNGPHVLIEVAELSHAAGIRVINGVQVGVVVRAVVQGQVQEVVLLVVVQGGPGLVGGIGDALQRHVDSQAGIDAAQGAFIVEEEVPHTAALGDDQSMQAVLIGGAVDGGGATSDGGDHRHGISGVVGAQIPVVQVAGLGIQDLEVGAVVAQAADAEALVQAPCNCHVLGNLDAVGGDPHGHDAAQVGDLIGVGVVVHHGIVGGAVDLVVHQDAKAEGANLSLGGPGSGIIGVEDRGLALAVLVPDDAAELDLGGILHDDVDFLGEHGLGDGGNRNGGLTHFNTGDSALLVDRGNGRIGAFHGVALVDQSPRHDVDPQVGGLALQQVQLQRLNDQLGGLLGGLDQSVLDRNNDQAGQADVEAAGVGLTGGAGLGGFAGGGVDGEQVVVGVGGGVVVAGKVQHVLVVVPGQGAAEAVVPDTHGADGIDSQSDGLDHGLLGLHGLFGGGIVAKELHGVNIDAVHVAAVVVPDCRIDLRCAGQLFRQVKHVGIPGTGDGDEVIAQLGHLVWVGSSANVDGDGVGVGGAPVLCVEGKLGVGSVAHINSGRNGPVVGGQNAALIGVRDDAGVTGGAAGGSSIGPAPVLAVAVLVHEGPALHGQIRVGAVEVEAGNQICGSLGFGLFGLFLLGQLELEQLDGGGGAVVGHVEGAVVVDGQGVGHGVNAGGGVQRQNNNRRQLAGDQIHLIDGVVQAQGIELIVVVVEGHVVDLRGLVGILAHSLGLVQGIQRSRVEPAVSSGHEDVAVHVLSGINLEVGVAVDAHAAKVGSGSIVQFLRRDLQSPVAGAHAAVGGGEAQHDGFGFLFGAAQGDLEGSLVAGVVGNQQSDLVGQLLPFQIQGNLDLLAGSVLLGNDANVLLGAGLVQNADVGDVVLVGGHHGDVAGDQVAEGALDHGSGVIHGDLVLDAGAVANDTGFQDSLEVVVGQAAGGGDLALQLRSLDGVVLGQGVEADGDLVALSHVGSGELLGHAVVGGAGVLPGAAVDVVVSAQLAGGSHLGEQHLAVRAGHGEAQVGGVTDVQVVEGSDGGFRVHGQPVGGELVLDDVGVAHVDGGNALGILQGHVVGVGVGQIGSLAGAVGRVDGGAAVQHGGIGPGAAEAKDGDGVDNVHGTLFVGHGLNVGVALDVEALGEVTAQQQSHPALVDLQIDGDLGGLGDLDGGSGAGVQQQLGVEGGDGAVAVNVGNRLVERGVLFGLAGDVIQDGLDVSAVGGAVHVDVSLDDVGVLVGLAVHLVGGLGADQHGGSILQHAVAAVAGHALGEDIGAEGEFLLAFQRIDGEGEAVLAGVVGVVAQLNLDLAVLGGVGEEGGVLVHQDVGLGSHSVSHVAQTGADADDGPIVAVGVVHRMSGGHQQGVDQLTLGQTGLLAQIVLTDVLTQHAGHAVDLRSGHGGTGHNLVVRVGLGGAAVADVGAPDGVDRATGGQDLRLQNHGAGNTVGGEGGNRDSVGGFRLLHFHFGGNAHGAGVVLQAVLGGDLLGVSLDGVAVGLQDGNCGSIVLITGQVHVDDAGLVVDDDHSHSALRHSRVGLGEEGGGAAVAHGDLAFQDLAAQRQELVAFLAHVLIVVNAGAVHQDVLVLVAGDGVDGLIAVTAGLGIEDVAVTEQQGVAGLTQVVNGGNSQGVGEGAGAAAGVVAGVIGVQIGVHAAVIGGVVPAVGVAHGDGADHPVGHQLVQHAFVAAGEAEARGAGAQRQVGGVAAQNDGVLDGDHVVGIISAAALAEDLHGDDLGVRGDTLGAHSLNRGLELAVHLHEAVGGGDALDVGAVLALGVLRMLDVVDVTVNIVVAEADLGVAVSRGTGTDVGVQLILDSVNAFGCQQIQRGHVFVVGHALGLSVLLQRVFQRFAGEGLVLGVDTGIDDGKLAAGTGVTGRPSDVGADHVGGGAVVGLVALLSDLGLVAVLQEHVLDTVDRLDGIDLAVEHVRGDVVGRKGQIPLHVQLAADRLFNLGGHGSLLVAEGLTVDPGRDVVRDVVDAEAGVQSGCLVQNDGHTDHVSQRMIFLCDGVFRFVCTKLLRLQLAGIGGDERQLFHVCGRFCGLCHGRRNQEGSQHRDHKRHRQDPAEQRCVLHCHVSFDRFLYHPLYSRERVIYRLGGERTPPPRSPVPCGGSFALYILSEKSPKVKVLVCSFSKNLFGPGAHSSSFYIKKK